MKKRFGKRLLAAVLTAAMMTGTVGEVDVIAEQTSEVAVESTTESVKSLEYFTDINVLEQIYTGEEIRPELAVQYGYCRGEGVDLVEGTDYTASFSNNIEPGTATVTITGIGSYSGTVTETFQIIPEEIGLTTEYAKGKIYVVIHSPEEMKRYMRYVKEDGAYDAYITQDIDMGTDRILFWNSRTTNTLELRGHRITSQTKDTIRILNSDVSIEGGINYSAGQVGRIDNDYRSNGAGFSMIKQYSGSVTITGCDLTYQNPIESSVTPVISILRGGLEMSDSTLTAPQGLGVELVDADGATFGQCEIRCDKGVALQSYGGKLDISQSEITSGAAAIRTVGTNTAITLSASEIYGYVGSSNTELSTAAILAGGKLTVSDGNIIEGLRSAVRASGDITINGGTFRARGAQSAAANEGIISAGLFIDSDSTQGRSISLKGGSFAGTPNQNQSYGIYCRSVANGSVTANDHKVNNLLAKGYSYGQNVAATASEILGAVVVNNVDKPRTIYLDYELNGGVNSKNNPKSYVIKVGSIPLEAPTKEHFIFGGWYWDEEFTQPAETVNTDWDRQRTLHARWTEGYTVHFEHNFQTTAPMEDMICEKDISYNLPVNTYTRKGYTFTGWNTKQDGTGTAYVNGAQIKNIAGTNQTEVHLYSQWKINTYALNYQLNGGTNHKSNVSAYTIVTPTISLKSPTRAGYLFGGWYSDTKYKTRVTAIYKGSTENKILYAKWVKVSVKKQTIKSAKNVSGKKIKLTYQKQTGVAGYQIQYSTKSNMKSAKTKTTTKTTYTLTKLKKGKYYYVRMKAYKLDSKGKKVYGTWSKVKKVKIKK